jgi:hypothetical protein
MMNRGAQIPGASQARRQNFFTIVRNIFLILKVELAEYQTPGPENYKVVPKSLKILCITVDKTVALLPLLKTTIKASEVHVTISIFPALDYLLLRCQ